MTGVCTAESPDDKSGPAIHDGTPRVFGGKPPRHQGQSSRGRRDASPARGVCESHPERFKADCMIIADMGNIEWAFRSHDDACAVTASARSKSAPSTTRFTPACSADRVPTHSLP